MQIVSRKTAETAKRHGYGEQREDGFHMLIGEGAGTTWGVVAVHGESIAVEPHDEWRCLCGNVASAHGFHPCTNEGDGVEPTDEEWPAPLYRCDGCGRIILDPAGDPAAPIVVGACDLLDVVA